MGDAGGASGSGGSASGGLNLATLTAEQLKQVAEQLGQESYKLKESFDSLQAAVSRYTRSGNVLGKLKEEQEGKELWVPLTSSMYVRGALKSTEKVLVDIGTGYYVEKTVPGGENFCQRKVTLLKEHMQKVADAIGEKQQQEQQVVAVLASKQQQQQQQQQKQ